MEEGQSETLDRRKIPRMFRKEEDVEPKRGDAAADTPNVTLETIEIAL